MKLVWPFRGARERGSADAECSGAQVRADAYETTTSADSYGAEIIHELQRQGDLAIAFTSIAEVGFWGFRWRSRVPEVHALQKNSGAQFEGETTQEFHMSWQNQVTGCRPVAVSLHSPFTTGLSVESIVSGDDVLPVLQAQGLRYWLERAGSTRLAGGHGAMPCCGGHALVLAAHGPDTAAGAEAVLRGTSAGALEPVADHRRVDCISRDSATFQGLVHALEEVFAAHAAAREA